MEFEDTTNPNLYILRLTPSIRPFDPFDLS